MSKDNKNIIIAGLLTVILAMVQPGTILVEDIELIQLAAVCAFEFCALVCVLYWLDDLMLSIRVERKRKGTRTHKRETTMTHYDISEDLAMATLANLMTEEQQTKKEKEAV